MMDVSYVEAVGLWWHGALDPNYMLWGLPVFAWERFGKLLGLIGGLTVILDIVGAPAVRRLGKKLRDLITFQEATRTMLYSMAYAVNHMFFINGIIYGSQKFVTKIYLSRDSVKREQNLQNLKTWFSWESKDRRIWEIGQRCDTLNDRFMVLITLVAIVVSFAVAFERWSGSEAVMFLVFFLALYTFVLMFVLDRILKIIWPTAAATALVLSSILAVIVDFGIDRIADVLEHPKNDALIRSVGVFLFLIGFHFDLLGS